MERMTMPRYTSTNTALAVATLTALAAIAHFETSHRGGASTVERTLTELTNSAAEWAANAGSASMSPAQLAVLLEGFDWQASLAPERPSDTK
jgi:hypothetical protein